MKTSKISMLPAVLLAGATLACVAHSAQADVSLQYGNPSYSSSSGKANPGVMSGSAAIAYTGEWLQVDNNGYNAQPGTADGNLVSDFAAGNNNGSAYYETYDTTTSPVDGNNTSPMTENYDQLGTTESTLTISGLTGTDYNVYLFGDGNGPEYGSTFTVDGSAAQSTASPSDYYGTGTGTSYVDTETTATTVGTYAEFASVAPVAGTLTITIAMYNPTDNSGDATSFLNGIQLQDVTASAAPEPSQFGMLALMGLGLGGLLLTARKKRSGSKLAAQ